jgi:N utilization substance protein A
VPDDQLSLAIGRRGQNVKLASQLVGWNIEINSESQIAALKAGILQKLTSRNIMEQMDIEYMFKLGLHSVENILGTPDDELLGLPGITADKIPAMREALTELRAEQAVKAEADKARLQEERRLAALSAQSPQGAGGLPGFKVEIEIRKVDDATGEAQPAASAEAGAGVESSAVAEAAAAAGVESSAVAEAAAAEGVESSAVAEEALPAAGPAAEVPPADPVSSAGDAGTSGGRGGAGGPAGAGQ